MMRMGGLQEDAELHLLMAHLVTKYSVWIVRACYGSSVPE